MVSSTFPEQAVATFKRTKDLQPLFYISAPVHNTADEQQAQFSARTSLNTTPEEMLDLQETLEGNKAGLLL